MSEDDVWNSWEKIVKEGAETIYISHGKSFKVDVLKKKLARKKR